MNRLTHTTGHEPSASPGIPTLLRWSLAVLGLGLLVYFGGGTIVTARTRGLDWQDTIGVVGAVLGGGLLALARLGGHAASPRIARGALKGGLIGWGLAIFPGMLLLGQLGAGEGLAPVFWAGLVLAPLALLVGAIVGGLRATGRPR